MKAIMHLKGGTGSGNFNHAGRPGEVGGSGPGDALQSFDSDYPTIFTELSSELSQHAKDFLERNQYKPESVDESLAAITYKSTSRELNTSLRAGEDMSKDMVVEGLDSMLDKSTLRENASTFRGVDSKVFPAESQVGRIFTDKGFVSTTISLKSAWGFSTIHSYDMPVVMQIGLKRGQSALNMDAIFDRGEAELLLPRGLSFKILSDSIEYLIPGNEDSIYRLLKVVPNE